MIPRIGTPTHFQQTSNIPNLDKYNKITNNEIKHCDKYLICAIVESNIESGSPDTKQKAQELLGLAVAIKHAEKNNGGYVDNNSLLEKYIEISQNLSIDLKEALAFIKSISSDKKVIPDHLANLLRSNKVILPTELTVDNKAQIIGWSTNNNVTITEQQSTTNTQQKLPSMINNKTNNQGVTRLNWRKFKASEIVTPEESQNTPKLTVNNVTIRGIPKLQQDIETKPQQQNHNLEQKKPLNKTPKWRQGINLEETPPNQIAQKKAQVKAQMEILGQNVSLKYFKMSRDLQDEVSYHLNNNISEILGEFDEKYDDTAIKNNKTTELLHIIKTTFEETEKITTKWFDDALKNILENGITYDDAQGKPTTTKFKNPLSSNAVETILHHIQSNFHTTISNTILPQIRKAFADQLTNNTVKAKIERVIAHIVTLQATAIVSTPKVTIDWTTIGHKLPVDPKKNEQKYTGIFVGTKAIKEGVDEGLDVIVIIPPLIMHDGNVAVTGLADTFYKTTN